MAKKRAGQKVAKKVARRKKKRPMQMEQQLFEGDGFPEKPPQSVLDAMNEYITAKREAAEAASFRGEREQILIEEMKKHGITRLPIEGENKFYEDEDE